MIQPFHSWGYTQKKMKILIQKDTTYNIYSSIIYNSQILKQLRVSQRDGWTDKDNVVYYTMEYY